MVRKIITSAAVAVSLMLGVPAVMNAQEAAPTMNIVETAVDAGYFNTLVAAVKAAGLVETLSGDGPFTVFAPTDEAFAEIPEDKLNALIADKEALTAVLTYHVVAGKVMAADVVNLKTAATVNGQSVDIKVMDGKVMIDGAEVIAADVQTTNGVIHVINKVILPDM
ncbi:MAG: fasciclin domain-containing protein [Gemmatimonadetes bacterium]|nr:fasciclin domain-containing protein [Gemmatimonadota bacterium]NNM06083.1 fasciclin domain-containing protein [Gemmatimonadota bacterium]